MSTPAVRFWVSAVLAALLFAGATSAWFPYEALRLRSEAEQWRAWLLTLWTGGVLALLFGASGLLAVAIPLGFREVHEAGSVAGAAESRRRSRPSGAAFHANFAWWLICTGAMLIAIYFAAWTLRIGA